MDGIPPGEGELLLYSLPNQHTQLPFGTLFMQLLGLFFSVMGTVGCPFIF
jgi:hypothetical protein